MLYLADYGSEEHCLKLVKESIESGKAFDKFREMVAAQGGDVSVIDDTSKFPSAKYSAEVHADKSGYITKINTEGYGAASLILGAGRNKTDEKIDYSAGIILRKKTGDFVSNGDVIATLYSNDKGKFGEATERLSASTEIGDEKPKKEKLILERIK